MQVLQAYIDSMRSAGIDASLETASHQVATLACNFIEHDTTYKNISQAAYAAWFGSHHVDPDRDAQLAASLPVNETAEVLSALENAIASAKLVLNGSASRLPVPSSNGSNAGVVMEGGMLQSNGTPILALGFTWGPSCADGTEAGLRTVMVDLWTSPQSFFPHGPDISPYAVEDYNELLSEHGMVGNLPAAFFALSQALPSWVEDRYLGVNNVTGPGWKQHFIGFDIDNPGAAFGVEYTFNHTLPLERAGARNASRMYRPYLLANEPGFTSSASPFTFGKYRSWLSNAYDGSIEALNAAWNASYSGFEDIPAVVPPTPPPALGPGTDPSNRPAVAARWSDWARFNNERVTKWFATMRTAAISADDAARSREQVHSSYQEELPAPACMLKLQNQLAFAAPLADGIDRVALTRLMDVSAMDSRILPADDASSRLILPREQWAWNASYWAADWASTAMGYTLSKSLSPAKPVLDTEWHGITTVRYRGSGGEITPAYTRGVLWFLAMQGLAGAETWYWARNAMHPDVCGKTVSPPSQVAAPGAFPWSITTLPGALDAIERTGIELSAMGTRVFGHPMRVTRPVRVLYSESSFIADPLSTSRTAMAVESIFFGLRGWPMGWIPESDLEVNSTSGVTSDTQLLVIPGTSHIGDRAFAALQSWVQSSPSHRLLCLGNASSPLEPSAALLRYTARGSPRTDSELRWLQVNQQVSYWQFDMQGGARAMAEPGTNVSVELGAAAASAEGKGLGTALICEEVLQGVTSDRSVTSEVVPSPAYGVYCGSSVLPDGSTVALMSNLRAKPVVVRLWLGSTGPWPAAGSIDQMSQRPCVSSPGPFAAGGARCFPSTSSTGQAWAAVHLPPLAPAAILLQSG